MKILCVSDLHYVSEKEYRVIPKGKYSYGFEFLKRVLQREKQNIDLIILPGDFVDNPDNPFSVCDFEKIVEELENLSIPFLLVKGNHDIEKEKFLKVGKKYTQPFILKDYIFYPFHDEYREDNVCFRRKEELENFEKFCKENPGKKVIAIQHNLVFPELNLTYPYNIENGSEILRYYKKNKVFLSISGHYHPGLPLIRIKI